MTSVELCKDSSNRTVLSYPIVLAADRAYAMPLATALRSLVESNPELWPLDITVLETGFDKEVQNAITSSLPQRSATIRFVPIDLSLFERFGTQSYISKMTYARFLIPTVFSEDTTRVLFLDSDVLVLNSLGPLFGINLEGKVLGAVMDIMDQPLGNGQPFWPGIPVVQRYFNAGMMLIDLEQWRKEKVTERGLDYLSTVPNSPYSDQDALNYACDGKWFDLDRRWNYQDHWRLSLNRLSAESLPAIVHFVAGNKPWNPRVRSSNAHFYDSFRSRTRFTRNLPQRCGDECIRVFAGIQNTLLRWWKSFEV